MIRRAAAVLLLLAAAGILLLAAWPQAVGLQSAPLIAQAVSLRAVAASGALLVAIVLLVLAVSVRTVRRFAAALVALLLVFVVVSAGILISRGAVNGTIEAADDDGLTVLAWNTLGDAPGAEAIADLVLESGADVVSLPETTEDTAEEVALLLRDAGRPMWVNTVSLDPELKARSTSLLTSADLGPYSVDESRGTTSVVPTVIAVPDDGDGPVIIAAHPVAPIPGYLDSWWADLRFLSTACRGEDVIMAGDLNSTLDHYQGLATSDGAAIGDCADAAAATGSAALGTWPTDIPPLLGSPIDHVMATQNWRAVSTQVVEDRDGLGSDHRPILARLVPAG